MNNNVKTKIESIETAEKRLSKVFSQFDSLAIAFSGGVDSTLLGFMAKKYVKGKVLLVNAHTQFSTEKEGEFVKRWAKENGLSLEVADFDIIGISEVQNNPPDRCYYCKKTLMKEVLAIAKKSGITKVADGSNIDDLSDYRPGSKATKELGILHPFIDANITKKNIRQLAEKYHLENANAPAQACLATRIPSNTLLLDKDLRQIEKAEIFLHASGFLSCRVRKLGTTAKIEVQPDQIMKLITLRETIVDYLKKLGFEHVTLDLEGYKQGSMNIEIRSV